MRRTPSHKAQRKEANYNLSSRNKMRRGLASDQQTPGHRKPNLICSEYQVVIRGLNLVRQIRLKKRLR